MGKRLFSKYILMYRYSDQEVILYNSLNSAVVLLDKSYINNLDKMCKEDIQELRDMLFFVSEDDVSKMIEEQLVDFEARTFNIIIEMTSACNFSCAYCYQNEWNKGESISFENLNYCIQYIENCIKTKKFDKVGLSFFGGEPLLEKEKIYYIYDKVKELCEQYAVSLLSEVTTNAYLLDKKFIEHFEQINILTTLSPINDHNKKRRLLSGESTYEKIMKNILECRTLFEKEQYLLGIRYNVDDANIESFGEFLEQLSRNKIKAKITTSYTYEHPMNDYCNLLTIDEYKRWNSSVAVNELIKHGFLVYQSPKVLISVCDGYYPYSIKVFADGTLGACNASVESSKSYKKGHISEIYNNIENTVNIFPEKKMTNILSDTCVNCNEKCVCGGVKFCRQYKMCDYSDINLEVFLKTYIDNLKKGGVEMYVWND